jgi:hypothetical protein
MPPTEANCNVTVPSGLKPPITTFAPMPDPGSLCVALCGLIYPQPAHVLIPLTGSVVVISSQTEQNYAFARDCLQMAEKATHEDVRLRLVELARHWIHAALKKSVPPDNRR